MEPKSYYLSSFRSVVIGIILLMMGLATTFIAFDINASFWDNFQSMFIDFRGVFYFITSLLLLLFKIGFFVMGWFILKHRGNMIRAQTDDKGLYFKEITGNNKYGRLAFDLNPLTFVPYSEIKNIYYAKDFWTGNYLELETISERKKLVTLNVLSNKEKIEIYNTVKEKINKKKTNKKSRSY